MLKVFRHGKKNLKWVLWVVILALGAGMLLLFVDAPTGTVGAVAGSQDVAVVAGQSIKASQYRRYFNQIYETYRQNYQLDASNTELIKQLGLGQRTLDELVSEYAAAHAAEELGIRATPEEIAREISQNPAFQQDGRFVGTERYLQVLQANNLGPAEYEAGVRRFIMRKKLIQVLTDSIRATPEEVRQDFLSREQEIKIRYVALDPEAMNLEAPTDEVLETFFQTKRENYRTPEQRKIRYVRIKSAPEQVELSEEQLEERIDSLPEKDQVRASHILLDKDTPESEVQELLAELRAGADFAELAKERSKDPGSAVTGGDLGFFGTGRMVPPFEAAAFALDPGQISEPVATQFGIHIIKVTDVKLNNRRNQAETELRNEQALELARNLATKLLYRARRDASLQAGADEYGVEVMETSPFALGDPIPGLSVGPEVNRQIFALSADEFTEPQQTPDGYIVAQLVETIPSALSDFDAVRDEVLEEWKFEQGEEQAREAAFAFHQALSPEKDFSRIASQRNLRVNTSEFFKRDASIDSELGYAREVLDRAFGMDVNEFSPPVSAGGQYVVFQVIEKSSIDEEAFQQEQEKLELELTNRKRLNFFLGWVQNVIQQLTEENRIQINQELVDSIVG